MANGQKHPRQAIEPSAFGISRGFAFVAGEGFYASHANPRTLRVSFGFLRDDVL